MKAEPTTKISIKHDGELSIAVGTSRKETHWKNKQTTWSELLLKLSQTLRTKETFSEYKRMTKDRQSEVKDVGGYVGGLLKNGRRKAGQAAWRSLITLDADYAQQDMIDSLDIMFGSSIAIYSTHSHSPEQPRLRLVIPLKRQVNPDEYNALSRFVAAEIGIDYFDDTTYQPERLMYWPSTAEDGEYLFSHIDGPWLDPDAMLAKHERWFDASTWPESSRAVKIRQRHADKQGNPLEKSGFVGAFNRIYDIPSAIDKYLSDKYTLCDVPNRYTYTEGSTSAGLVVYDGDLFAFSNHSTDPASGMLCNAFDLVRVHLFGMKDDDEPDTTPIHLLPSYHAMQEFALKDKLVKIELINSKNTEAADEFKEDLDDTHPDGWKVDIEYTAKGSIIKSINNALLIIRNDPRLKGTIGYDEFKRRTLVRKSLPWRSINKGTDWTDADDAGLRHYMEMHYGFRSDKDIKDAFMIAMKDNTYHPIREYLDSLAWDEVNRLDTVLIDYLGTEDTIYNRAISRKWLIAAAGRIKDPGCKFDNMLILVGKQGVGKSQFFNRLAVKLDWFSDSMSRIDNSKDAMEQLSGKWIMELGELSVMKKSEVEHIKTFLSKQEDTYRQAYGRNVETYRRQCVFAGTTNRDDFLTDSTGNRRFWTVKVRNTSKLWSGMTPEVVNQIWAEADFAYSMGENLYLEEQEAKEFNEKQKSYTDLGGKAGLAGDFLEIKLPENWKNFTVEERLDYFNGFDFGEPSTCDCVRDKISGIELFVECFNGRPENYTRRDSYEMTDIIRSLGWESSEKTTRTKAYGVQKYFIKEDEFSVENLTETL